MALLTAQRISRAGLQPVFVAAEVGGDTFANRGNMYFEAINADASETTLTFEKPITVGGLAVDDLAVAVPPGETRKIGVFSKKNYNNTLGEVSVTYSSVTALTVGVFEMIQ